MSPSEDDLRASLSRGEGEAPDAGRIVAAALAARSQRRKRFAAVAGGVVTVVVVAGGAVLIGVGTGRSDRPVANGSDQSTANGSEPRSTSSEPVLHPASCPATFPRRFLPGGGSSQFGSGLLFAAKAASITVCGYGADEATQDVPAQLVLTGAEAATLQRSLEDAPRVRSGTACPLPAPSSVRRFAFTATTTDGSPMRVVTATLPACNNQVTNGSAVRFGWVPPGSLADRLFALTPSTAAPTPTSSTSAR